MLGRVFLGLSSLGVSLVVARLLAPADVGVYALALSVATFGAVVGCLGLTQVVVRFVAAALAVGDEPGSRRAARRCLGLGIFGAAVFGAVYAIGIHPLVGDQLGVGPLPGVLVAVWFVVLALQQLVAETFRGFGEVRRAALFGGPSSSLAVLAVLLLAAAAGWRPGPTGVVAAVVGVSGAALLVSGVVLTARLAGAGAGAGLGRLTRPVRWVPDVSSPRAGGPARPDLLAAAAPLLLVSGLYGVMTLADLWILGISHGGDDVGVYAVAARTATLAGMPFLVVHTTLLPMIAELYAQGRRAELTRLVRWGALAATVPTLGVTLVFAVAGGPLLGLAFGPAYRHGALVLVLLGAGHTAGALAGPSGAVLAMCGQERLLSMITLTVGGATVAAMLVTVPATGAVGAAAVTAAGLTAQGVATTLGARRTTGVLTSVGLPRRGPGRAGGADRAGVR